MWRVNESLSHTHIDTHTHTSTHTQSLSYGVSFRDTVSKLDRGFQIKTFTKNHMVTHPQSYVHTHIKMCPRSPILELCLSFSILCVGVTGLLTA
jgi:hypothetical protein